MTSPIRYDFAGRLESRSRRTKGEIGNVLPVEHMACVRPDVQDPEARNNLRHIPNSKKFAGISDDNEKWKENFSQMCDWLLAMHLEDGPDRILAVDDTSARSSPLSTKSE